MTYGCPKCSIERDIYVMLEGDERGVLVCSLNPKHRFRINPSGFLESVPER